MIYYLTTTTTERINIEFQLVGFPCNREILPDNTGIREQRKTITNRNIGSDSSWASEDGMGKGVYQLKNVIKSKMSLSLVLPIPQSTNSNNFKRPIYLSVFILFCFLDDQGSGLY